MEVVDGGWPPIVTESELRWLYRRRWNAQKTAARTKADQGLCVRANNQT